MPITSAAPQALAEAPQRKGKAGYDLLISTKDFCMLRGKYQVAITEP